MISLASLPLLIIIIFLSLVIGRRIQESYNVMPDIKAMAFPIGFGLIFAIHFLICLPFIVLKSNTTILAVMTMLSIFVSAIYAFYPLNKRSILQILKDKYYYYLFATAILVTIWTLLIKGLNEGTDQIWYESWMRTDSISGSIFHGIGNYNEQIVGNNNPIYFSQTWYLFNSTIILVFKTSPSFIVGYFDGVLNGYLAMTVLIAFFKYFREKENPISWLLAFLCITLLQTIAFHFQLAITGLVERTYLFIAISILFVNYYKTHNNYSLFIISFITISAWAFSSSTMFIYGLFAVACGAFMLATKKDNTSYATTVMLIPSIFFFIIYKTKAHSWNSLIIVEWFIYLISTAYIYKCVNKQIIWRKLDVVLFKYKWTILLSFLFSISTISIIIWATGKSDSWNNFNPHQGGLWLWYMSGSWVWIYYSFYWLQLIGLAAFVFYSIKKSNITKDVILLGIVSFSFIAFFNPLVSGLWSDSHLITREVYHRLRTNTIMMGYLWLISFVLKVKLEKISQPIIVLGSFSSLNVPLLVKNINTIKTFDYLNGGLKGIQELKKYLESKPNFTIAGDVMYLRGKIPNPLPFQKGVQWSKFINKEAFDKLKNQTPDILIKATWNTNLEIDQQNIYKTKMYFENYVVFIK